VAALSLLVVTSDSGMSELSKAICYSPVRGVRPF
jgi:hypothetical protein